MKKMKDLPIYVIGMSLLLVACKEEPTITSSEPDTTVSTATSTSISAEATINQTDNQGENGSLVDEESEGTEETSNEPGDSILEKYVGEYEYTTDLGKGRLIIEKSEYSGYDISDYKEDNSYRFLANSSNMYRASENEIAIKYPAIVYSDDTAVFEYYTFKLGKNMIDVEFSESENDEPKNLYSASLIGCE